MAQPERTVPLSSPDITERERRAVLDVLATGRLSLGPKVSEFEERVAAYVGTRHAVAVNSGTSALHLCVRASGIGEGDEVITTPFSFVASANCLLYERAVPVFVDIDPLTFNLDVGQIEAKITGRTKAVLAVHVFGRPCEMDVLVKVCQHHGLRLIEDACEALGARYSGRMVGTFGDCGTFAFYPNKQMTTAEGGVIVTDDEAIARLCASMRNQGRGAGEGWLAHERLGFNYRLSDIHCALGIAQLERIDELLAKRTRIAARYDELLQGLPGLRARWRSPGVTVSWFVYVVTLQDHFSAGDRDAILRGLTRRGIGCSNYFPPIHLQPFYADRFDYRRGAFPITESIAERSIALPFHGNLSEDDLQYVVSGLGAELEESGSPGPSGPGRR